MSTDRRPDGFTIIYTKMFVAKRAGARFPKRISIRLMNLNNRLSA
jgi:hypothetical protein